METWGAIGGFIAGLLVAVAVFIERVFKIRQISKESDLALEAKAHTLHSTIRAEVLAWRAQDSDRIDKIREEWKTERVAMQIQINKEREANEECVRQHAVAAQELAVVKVQLDYVQKELQQYKRDPAGPASMVLFSRISAKTDGTIIDAEGETMLMFGYRTAELVGKDISMLVSTRTLSQHQQAFNAAVTRGNISKSNEAIAGMAKRKKNGTTADIPVIIRLKMADDATHGKVITATIFEVPR